MKGINKLGNHVIRFLFTLGRGNEIHYYHCLWTLL